MIFCGHRHIIITHCLTLALAAIRYKNTRSQGSPHLQKIGRLDFSLREHEGEVKA
jgi:hypothetical protein